ncbi:MAG: LPS export ABC transporter periplasmic protein LptC [Betaproteobacteria bacterium]
MKDSLRQRLLSRLSSWFPVMLLASLAMLTYWLDAQVQRTSPGDGRADQDPDYYLEDFAAMRFGPDGSIVQRLTAKRMLHYSETRPTELIEPTIVVTPPGKSPMQVRSDIGKVSQDTNHVYLRGHVVATREADARQSKLTLSTEYLHVVPREEKAMTDRSVTITDAIGTHVGGAMEMDNKARTLRLHGGVSGEIKSAPQ